MLARLRRSGAGPASRIDPGGGLGHAPRDVPPFVASYELVREIHRGGQGVIYEAIQPGTGRRVALKLLLPGVLASMRQRMRFEREIDILASLRHEGIVTVYDSGITDDGRHWLAMELIEGQPLDVYGDGLRQAAARAGGHGRRSSRHDLRAGRPLHQLLRAFILICDAVAAAHRRGVIHRDLKPGNILVVDHSSAAGSSRSLEHPMPVVQPKLLDFGLARPLDAALDRGAAAVTMPGAFLGTPAYASPEQTQTDADIVDVRSDVYALGVILYEMLSGDMPYPVTGSLSDVLDTIRTRPPRPLRSRRDLPWRIDRDLETIVRTAMAKEPQRRYQTVDHFRGDIERAMRHEPIDARRDSAWYVAGKFVGRHRWRVGLAAALFLVLVGFSIAMAVLYRRAAAEARKVSTINTFLEDTLGSAAPTSPSTGGELTVAELLDEGSHWVDLVLDDQPEIEAAVRTILGNAYRNLGHFDAADAHLGEALRLREALFGDEDLETAKSLSMLALLRRDQGRLVDARTLLDQALQIRRRALGETHLDVAIALANRASVDVAANDLDQAEQQLRAALEMRMTILGPHHADVAMTQFMLADVLEQAGRFEEAAQLHRQALAIRETILHEQHPDLARSRDAVRRLHAAP